MVESIENLSQYMHIVAIILGSKHFPEKYKSQETSQL